MVDLTYCSFEVAYILGLLWADGHVREAGKNTYYISIKALTKDLSEVLNVFESTGTWGVKECVVEGRQNRLVIGVTDAKLGKVLDGYGFLEKSKISPNKLLKTIPHKLVHYFFRGYFDGDGCITLVKNKYPNVLFCGSYEQDFTFVEDLLNQLKINYKVYRRIQSNKSKNSTVVFSGRNNSKILYNYLWNGKVLGFSRKREKFELLLNEIEDRQRRYITHNGVTKTLREWSEERNIPRHRIANRIDRYNWTVEKALGF